MWSPPDGLTPPLVRGVVHVRRGGASLVLGLPPDMPPCVLHWPPALGDGDLGDVGAAVAIPVGDSVVAAPSRLSVLALHSAGRIGRPGLLRPELTSVSLPLLRAGREAADLVERPTPRPAVLPVELVVRGSTARARGVALRVAP